MFTAVTAEHDTLLHYALTVLLGESCVDQRLLAKIVYANPTSCPPQSGVLFIVPSTLFGEHYGKAISIPTLPLKEIEGVPLLYGLPVVQRKGSNLIVHADIVASTYFLVTRYEEMVRRDVRDEHGRFPGRESLPCRAGFIHRPIVEEYGRLLRSWLSSIGIFVRQTPGQLSVTLTHDVDRPWLPWNPRHLIRPTLRSLVRKPSRALDPLLSYFGCSGRDPYDTFDDLVEVDRTLVQVLGRERVNTIYFLLTKRSYMDRAPRRTSKLVARLLTSGAEIGLHTSCEAGCTPKLVQAEADRLREFCDRPVTANRHHYLAWREPEDVSSLETAHILHDYTMGYADCVGFRLGICHPVRYFDPVAVRQTRVVVHPLSIMECTLDKYMRLSFVEAKTVCQAVVDTVAAFQGELVLLWHNTTISDTAWGYQRKLYQELVGYILTRYA